MRLPDFLHSVGLSGTLQYSQEFPSKKESYYVIRLRNPGLSQRYIITHDDTTRSERCALSIQRYEATLKSCMNFLESVGDLHSIEVDLNNN